MSTCTVTMGIAPSNRPSRAHKARIARAGELGQIISLTDTPKGLDNNRACSVIESAMALWTHHYKEEPNPDLMQRLLGSGTSVAFGEIEVPCAVSEGLSTHENNGWPVGHTLEQAADETISATRNSSEKPDFTKARELFEEYNEVFLCKSRQAWEGSKESVSAGRRAMKGINEQEWKNPEGKQTAVDLIIGMHDAECACDAQALKRCGQMLSQDSETARTALAKWLNEGTATERELATRVGKAAQIGGTDAEQIRSWGARCAQTFLQSAWTSRRSRTEGVVRDTVDTMAQRLPTGELSVDTRGKLRWGDPAQTIGEMMARATSTDERILTADGEILTRNPDVAKAGHEAHLGATPTSNTARIREAMLDASGFGSYATSEKVLRATTYATEAIVRMHAGHEPAWATRLRRENVRCEKQGAPWEIPAPHLIEQARDACAELSEQPGPGAKLCRIAHDALYDALERAGREAAAKRRTASAGHNDNEERPNPRMAKTDREIG